LGEEEQEEEELIKKRRIEMHVVKMTVRGMGEGEGDRSTVTVPWIGR
jgi:hypothetical protein